MAEVEKGRGTSGEQLLIRHMVSLGGTDRTSCYLVVAKAFVSLVTVCGASDMLVQTTYVPFGMDSVAGSKEYFPLFSTIFTFITAADVGLAGEVAAVVGLDCEAVGVGVVAVPPPHAAKIMVAGLLKIGYPRQIVNEQY